MKLKCLLLFFPFIAGLFLTVQSGKVLATEQTLSLNEAVESALKNNLNLQLRKEDVSQAEGATESAWGKFDPFISAEAATQSQTLRPLIESGLEDETTTAWDASLEKRFQTGTDIDISWKNNYLSQAPSPYLLDPLYNSTLTVGVSQPLLKGFGSEVQTAELKASEKQEQASTHLVDSEAADLVAEVKNAYWQLVFAQQDLQVQELSLELAIKLLEEIKERIRAGKLAEVEIYRPESEVARREESLITGERAIGFAEDNLKFLINSKDWTTSYTPKDLPDLEIIQPNLEKVLHNALTNRPDLKASELFTQAAELREKEAKNNILPNLALIGAIGAGGTDETYGNSLDTAFEDSETIWSVGLNFSVPLHNSLAKGQYIQARAEINRARTTSELLRQDIRRTVRITVRDVYLAIKAMEATEKTSIASQKGLEAEKIKFDAGRATSLDVLVAQETYSQALSQVNRAKTTYAQVLAELDRIQGIVHME